MEVGHHAQSTSMVRNLWSPFATRYFVGFDSGFSSWFPFADMEVSHGMRDVKGLLDSSGVFCKEFVK